MTLPTAEERGATPGPRAPAIFLLGNCQVHFVAAVLQALFPGRVFVVGKPLGAAGIKFFGLIPVFLDTNSAQSLISSYLEEGVPLVAVRQSTPLGVTQFEPPINRHGFGCDIVIPHLEFYSLWPERRGLRDASPERLARLRRGDLASLKVCAAKATVFTDASDRVEAAMRCGPSFQTANHPRGDLYVPILEGVLGAIGGENLLASNRQLIETLARHSAVDFDSAHPIPSDRLDALGFDWGASYRAWSEGRAALERGDAKAAVAELERAMPDLVQNWQFRGDLGMAYLASGEIDHGLRHVGWASAANTENMHLQSRWLYTLLRHGMKPVAVAHRIAMARELHPGYAPLAANYAQACLADPHLGDAEIHARAAAEMEPKDDNFACLLAQTIWEKGRGAEAVRELEVFVARVPDARYAPHRLARYRKELLHS